MTRIKVRKQLSKQIKAFFSFFLFFSPPTQKESFCMFLKRHPSHRAGLVREAV